MSESLFWQDGFPKERRIDLVAALLYAKDQNARIPNNEGLRPDRVDDFYATVRFQSAEDFDARMAKVRTKYRYSDISVEADALRALPSADPFERFFIAEQLEETPAIEAQQSKARRPRAPRATASEQSIVSAPKPRIESLVEMPVLESPVVEVAAPDVSESAPVPHAEDRVSALARSVLAWFHRDRSVEFPPESGADSTVDPSRLREVVSVLFSKELGADAFKDGVHDPKVLAHLEAAKRLERAITTSQKLNKNTRAALQKRLEALRATYQDQMATLAGKRRAELHNGLDEGIAAQTSVGEHVALRFLARRNEPIAKQLVAFQEHVEHAALQRGGVETVAQIDAAFQNAWQEAWRGPVTSNAIGPLEDSLPGLRRIQGRGAARLVAEARLSVQETVDRELPKTERAMRRAA